MDLRVNDAIEQCCEYIRRMAEEKKFGDIMVTISLVDGVPDKITNSFCVKYVQRRTGRIVNKSLSPRR